jgi:hypothetical protein
MSGHAQDVQGAIGDLEREQDLEPPQRHRAVDMEEADPQHAGRLRAQETAANSCRSVALEPVGSGGA